MATQGTFTIGGASPDYATIQAWADSPTGNLTGVYQGKVRAGDYAEQVDINIGFTTSSSAYMELIPDDGAHHRGVYGDGVVITGDGLTTEDHALHVFDDYTRIRGISITEPRGRSREGVRIQAGNCRFEEMLAWNINDLDQDFFFVEYTTSDTTYISNCHSSHVARGFLTCSDAVAADGATFYVYNCTGIRCGTGYYSDDGLRGGIVFTVDASTTARTINAKNCYFDLAPTSAWRPAAGSNEGCFVKPTNDSWGNSTNNASSDTTAPGANAQTSLTYSSQIVQPPTVETIGDDDGASAFDYDCGENRATAVIDKNNPTTANADSVLIEYNSLESPVQVQGTLLRMDLSALPAPDRVYAVSLVLTSNATIQNNFAVRTMFAQMNRNWTTSATWNTYDGTNSWATAGGLGAADRVAAAPANFDNAIAQFAGDTIADGDETKWFAGPLARWVKDAMNGVGPSPVGADYIDILIHQINQGANDTPQGFDSFTHGTVANRPYFEIVYDTASTPADWRPDTAGSLDAAGTDLSGDTDYPINTDVTGYDRSGWDIGAFAVGVVLPVSATDGAEASDSATVVAYPPLQGLWFNETYETDPGTDETYASTAQEGTSTYDADFATSSVTGAPTSWGDDCLQFNFVTNDDTYLEYADSYERKVTRYRIEFVVPSAEVANIQAPSLFASILDQSAVAAGDDILSLSVTNGGVNDFRLAASIYDDGTQNTTYTSVFDDTPYRVELVWNLDDSTYDYTVTRMDTWTVVQSTNGNITGDGLNRNPKYFITGAGGKTIGAGQTFTMYVDNARIYDDGGVFGADGAEASDSASIDLTLNAQATDGADAGDTATAALTVPATGSEGVDAGESATASLTITGSETEGVDAGESATVVVRSHSKLCIIYN